MSNCVMCGLSVPSGQRVCSMCYGDMDYGRDGYYRDFLEEELRKKQENVQDEQEDW